MYRNPMLDLIPYITNLYRFSPYPISPYYAPQPPYYLPPPASLPIDPLQQQYPSIPTKSPYAYWTARPKSVAAKSRYAPDFEAMHLEDPTVRNHDFGNESLKCPTIAESHACATVLTGGPRCPPYLPE